MARTGPTTLSLPSFDGATRRLVLINIATFFGLSVIRLVSEPLAGKLLLLFGLIPARLSHGFIWQLGTFAFVNNDLLGTLFGALTLWFFGAMLEGSYGSRWLYQLYLFSALGGGLIGSALSFTGLFHLSPIALINGPWSGIYGLYIAALLYFGDVEILFFFVVRMKLRYMVAILIVVQLARLVAESDAFEAAVLLSAALSGYLFLKYAPRRGFAYSFSERYYALRNEYYRSKRRRAARKFEVYMKKQDREVHFDKDGKYIDPDQDPNDKRWMN
jgi:membrane associated rhomboid family serine protease